MPCRCIESDRHRRGASKFYGKIAAIILADRKLQVVLLFLIGYKTISVIEIKNQIVCGSSTSYTCVLPLYYSSPCDYVCSWTHLLALFHKFVLQIIFARKFLTKVPLVGNASNICRSAFCDLVIWQVIGGHFASIINGCGLQVVNCNYRFINNV